MTESVAPGWCQDGTGVLRYWDGNAWTISEAEYVAIAAPLASSSASAVASCTPSAHRPETVRYKGRDGSLVVDGEFVVVEHNDASIPDFRFPQSSITAVHFERATMFVSGILTIAVGGAPLVVPTGTDCGSDPHSVVFRRPANDTFVGLHVWLRQIVSENTGPLTS